MIALRREDAIDKAIERNNLRPWHSVIFPLRLAGFPIKTNRNAQWVHFFFFFLWISMISFLPFTLFFSLIVYSTILAQLVHHIPAITFDKGM